MGRSERHHRKSNRDDDEQEERHKLKKRTSRDDDENNEECTSSRHHRSKRGEDKKEEIRNRRDDRRRERGSDDEEDRKERREHKKKKERSSSRRHSRDRNEEPSTRRDVKRKHDKTRDRKDKKKRVKKEESREGEDRKTQLIVDKSKLFPLGDPLGHPPDTLLDSGADYFSFHKHLWLYLYRDCSIAFNDLSSEEARSVFSDFVKRYNAGELEIGYYAENLPVAALEECKTTRHSWGLKISDQEDKSLQVLHEGVHKQTEYLAQPRTAEQNVSSSGNNLTSSTTNRLPPGARPSGALKDDERRKTTPEDRHMERLVNRRLREHVKTADEELTGGRKEGRERVFEKRKELSAKIHGASRDAEAVELNDDALYGGDGAEFQRALASSKQRAADQVSRKHARATELQQKEHEKQKAMLEMLGLSDKIQAGQKIQIQPRNDG